MSESIVRRADELTIKQLKEENNKLLDVINNQDVKISDLEKENAELKSEKGCETCTKFDEVQLTKAKEIIALGLRVCETSSIEYMNLYQKQAEQFFKEIEK